MNFRKISDALYAPLADGQAAPELHVEACAKCRGTGQTRWGTCFSCNGRGSHAFKTSFADRAKARDKAASKRIEKAQDVWATFAAAEPTIAAWIEANRARFPFAQSMHEAVTRWGTLTDGQKAACQRSVDKAALWAADRQTRSVGSEIDTTAIDAAFAVANAKTEERRVKAAAKGRGVKEAVLRFAGFTISAAKPTSANPGALYVKNGGTYLGKIKDGRFMKGRDCDAATESKFRCVAIDPKAAAIAYGRETGSCSVCGAELTAEDSVEAGIGPICAANFGW
jgi:hypothetical protein